MKDEVIKGLRMDITLRSYSNVGSPTLHSIWTMMVMWGRVSNHKFDLSTEVVSTNKWKGSETSLQIKSMPLYWFHGLGEKGPFKEAWSSSQDIPWLCYCLDIYGHQNWAQLWRNTHHFWHLRSGLHQRWKKRQKKWYPWCDITKT